jgi:hypothetical protein
MERLTKEQAEERLRALGCAPADGDFGLSDIDASLTKAIRELPAAIDREFSPDVIVDIVLVFIAHKAHCDYEAGKAAALAQPVDSIVKPGDLVQDMEALHRDNRQRVMTVKRLSEKAGVMFAHLSQEVGRHVFLTTIRLDRIHRRNIKTGWRVLDGGG